MNKDTNDFTNWMRDCDIEFHIINNRYGYHFGHGFLCIAMLGDCFNVCDLDYLDGPDLKALEMMDELLELNKKGLVYMHCSKDPVFSMMCCKEELMNVWMDGLDYYESEGRSFG